MQKALSANAVGIAAYRNAVEAVVRPERMIAMGFVGLHEYLQRAERAFAAGDGASRAVALDAAFRVVEHLLVALDQNSKAEGVSNLTDLYLFLLDRISRANIFNAPELLAECRPVVENLREAWTQIADNADR